MSEPVEFVGPVEFVDAAQEEWVAEVVIPDQPTSITARSEIITVALRLGVMMLEAGFDTRAAINAMTGCARALGMADLSVTAVGRTMMASHVSERGVPIMMTRAAATIDSFDLHRMGRLHQVLAEMLREDVDVKHASDLMDQLERESSPWPWWIVVLGGMVLAASITLQTGGSLVAAALASGCLLLVNRFGALLDRIGLPKAFSVSGQAALAVLLGVLLNVCGLATISASAAIIATGLVLLLPIPQIVQAAQDAINTYYVTAAARLTAVLVLVSMTTLGGTLALSQVGGVNATGAAFATRPGPLELWLVIVACMVGALGNAVFMRGGPRLLLPAAGAGALTGIVNVVLQRHASLDPTLAVGIAALVLGVVSGLSSGYLRIPSTELCIVGIAGALLPGLDVYWIIVSEVFKFSGAGEAFLRALVAVLVIGPSVVLGMWLVGRIRSNGKE